MSDIEPRCECGHCCIAAFAAAVRGLRPVVDLGRWSVVSGPAKLRRDLDQAAARYGFAPASRPSVPIGGSVNQLYRMTRGLLDVKSEQLRQVEKWGVQHHPDGTGATHDKAAADYARELCDGLARAGHVTWRAILAEEVYEAFAESDSDKLRTELIQVAAVAVSWVNDIDSRVGQ